MSLSIPTFAGLDVTGNGRGCNTSSGRFDVLELLTAVDGSVELTGAPDSGPGPVGV